MPGRSWPGSAGASPPDEQPLGATPDSTSEPAQCCGSTPRTRCWSPRLNSARVTLHRLRECWCRATSETRCSVYLVIHLSWISRTGTGLRKCSFSRGWESCWERWVLATAHETRNAINTTAERAVRQLVGQPGRRLAGQAPPAAVGHAGPYGGSQRSTPSRSPSKAASSHLRRTNRDHSHWPLEESHARLSSARVRLCIALVAGHGTLPMAGVS